MRDRRDHAHPSVNAGLARKGRDWSIRHAVPGALERTDLSLGPGLGQDRS